MTAARRGSVNGVNAHERDLCDTNRKLTFFSESGGPPSPPRGPSLQRRGSQGSRNSRGESKRSDATLIPRSVTRGLRVARIEPRQRRVSHSEGLQAHQAADPGSSPGRSARIVRPTGQDSVRALNHSYASPSNGPHPTEGAYKRQRLPLGDGFVGSNPTTPDRGRVNALLRIVRTTNTKIRTPPRGLTSALNAVIRVRLPGGPVRGPLAQR
jgi:hypothetical protein